MTTTNVHASELNYDKYTADQYDRDIINSIPRHKELHEHIIQVIRQRYNKEKKYSIIDLGVGTAITSDIIRNELPNATFDLVDFSENMLLGAKKRMGEKNMHYILGDYANLELDRQYDIAVSVIGLHHQNTEGKKKMFQKIYDLLKPGGVFIFGDLMTYKDKHMAALQNAKHFHHLVEHSADEETLKEWAYHHQFLNDLSPLEDQIEWLTSIGYTVSIKFTHINTCLLICQKNS
jgi:tRNA (cmo5U34)-methyltransferase